MHRFISNKLCVSFPKTFSFHAFLSLRFKSSLTMNTAFFRLVDGDESFHVAMRYVNPDLKIDKQFNFCRKLSETAGAFTNRIDANLDKALDKKSKRKKVADVESPPKREKSSLICNGNAVDSEYPCSDIFEKSADSFALGVLGDQVPIKVNVPWIEALSLPKSTMAGFLIYPSKFEAFFVDKTASTWQWHRCQQANGKNWQLCGQGEFYETQTDDIGHYLKVSCTPSNGKGDIGPTVEAITPSVVEAGPGPLPFCARHIHTKEHTGANGLRVCSYNILADLYVDSDYSRTVLFGYCPAYALELPYRRQLLLKEIMGYNTDLLCLQEVDTKVFRYDLVPILRTQGLSGIFSQKGNTVNEGSAVFFRDSKFKMLKNWSVLLSDLLQKEALFAELYEKIKTNQPFVERILGRSTTLQVVLLECLGRPGQYLLAANIHLYFHPDADHVRLFQAGICITYLQNLLQLEEVSLGASSHISLVWCGDFNSVPECGIYQLLTTGHVPDSHLDWSSNETEKLSGVSFSHGLNLGSACGTPQYTNYTVGFKACLDYIFYDETSFTIDQIVPFPYETVLSTHAAIPSVVFPSDHVALISDLKISNT